MLSSPAVSKTLHQREHSRSNSTSPSSVVTAVQRTTSITTSRPTSRQQYHHQAKARPHTPSDSTPRSATSTPTFLTDSFHRRGASETRTTTGRDSVSAIREGVGNLNRWSQSTGSSKTSTEPRKGHAPSHSQSSRKSSIGSAFASSPKRNFLSKDRFSPARSRSTSTSAPNPPDVAASTSMHPGTAVLLDFESSTYMHPSADDNYDTSLPALKPSSPFGSLTNSPNVPSANFSPELLTPATYNAGLSTRNFSRSRSPGPNRGLNTGLQPQVNPPVELRPSAESLHTQLDNDRPGSSINRSRDDASPGHSRNRSDRTKGSGSTISTAPPGGSISSLKDASRGRRTRAPSQKVMLSRALQKANTAVLLDNAHNFEGAIEAYHDACQLLQQVMQRSSGDDERRKLEAIRRTYTTRIAELQTLDLGFQPNGGKALPQRPMSDDSLGQPELMSALDEEVESGHEDDAEVEVGTAMPLRIVDQVADRPQQQQVQGTARQSYAQADRGQRFKPDPRESMVAPPFDNLNFRDSVMSANARDSTYPESYFDASLADYDYAESIAQSMDTAYMPPPLSPRRPLSPKNPSQLAEYGAYLSPPDSGPSGTTPDSHETTTETTSWLDTIDESGDDSSASSVHSTTNSMRVRRKQLLRPSSSHTEAEFDAALDAAVEAAYDEGFEPDDLADDYHGQYTSYVTPEPPRVESFAAYVDPDHFLEPDPVISNARRNVELAKERVREAEREAAIALAKEKEKWRLYSKDHNIAGGYQPTSTLDYLDDEAEEEERMLDEMTKGYIMDEFEFDLGSKSALPRESDSSGFSGRTWGSSVGSTAAVTAGTSLSTLEEGAVLPSTSLKQAPQQAPPLPLPPVPPPAAALPALPTLPPTITIPSAPSAPASTAPSVLTSATSSSSPAKSHKPTTSISGLPTPTLTTLKTGSESLATGGVRDRRLSGQNARQLKIETAVKPLPDATPVAAPMPVPEVSTPSPTSAPEPPPKSASAANSHKSKLSDAQSIVSSRSGVDKPLPDPERSEAENRERAGTPVFSKPTYISVVNESKDEVTPMPGSPARLFRKASGDALRKMSSANNLKGRNLSISTPDAGDVSPITPGSYFPPQTDFRKPSILPTPTGTTFTINGMPTGGLYLFESDIHSPTSPGMPNPIAANAPNPLEPCPESFLLRPFWLMRCLYQTIAHPKGGYLSTKLFVPRDVWRVKNVKIKNVDEKVANCDLLTAALLKLGQVDTLDADAVLEEMQALEMVLDQVQTVLSKKLGNEVGLQNATHLFKNLSSVDEAGVTDTFSSRPSISGKSYLTSWRKLRSKSSGAGLANTVTNVTSLRDLKEAVTMSSIPMTATTYSRTAKRTPGLVQCTGPHANYMGALARLFDAAQILDQIARQVEDPGLKYSSQTHVGLELSTRHAAEFFGFYICRFALNDVGMMLDKFVKRGTEWVMA